MDRRASEGMAIYVCNCCDDGEGGQQGLDGSGSPETRKVC